MARVYKTVNGKFPPWLFVPNPRESKIDEGFNQIVVVFSSDDYAMSLADSIATPAGGEHWCMRAPNVRVIALSIMVLRRASQRNNVSSVAISLLA
jgi:hypothetical protein